MKVAFFSRIRLPGRTRAALAHLVTFGFLAAFAFAYLIFMRNLLQQPSI